MQARVLLVYHSRGCEGEHKDVSATLSRGGAHASDSRYSNVRAGPAEINHGQGPSTGGATPVKLGAAGAARKVATGEVALVVLARVGRLCALLSQHVVLHARGRVTRGDLERSSNPCAHPVGLDRYATVYSADRVCTYANAAGELCRGVPQSS